MLFPAGGLARASVALLLAPRPGSASREALRSKLDETVRAPARPGAPAGRLVPAKSESSARDREDESTNRRLGKGLVAEDQALRGIGPWFARQRAYAIGLAVLVLAAAVKLSFDPLADARTPFLLLLGTVMTAAWYGGLLPGLATTLLAALVGDYLFVPAGSSFTSGQAAHGISLVIFLIEGSLISILGSRLSARPPPEQERPKPAEPRKAEAPVRQLEPELETLNRLGLALAGQLDKERLVEAVTDAGVAITGAAFGAFLYGDAPDGATHYVSGAPPETFVDFPLFQDANAFGSPFLGAVSRSDDLAEDPRYGQNLPFKQMPPGSLPARSYLAAPVRSRTGELLGGLFFGHPDPGFFHERDERLIAGLAAHAAIAVDNAHLYREAQEARAVAEAANGLKDEFLATLSHELRTPLTAIVGWAHLLEGSKLPAAETARAVDVIIRNATAQNHIIDELLDVSRIITGKLQLDLRPVDIATVVKAAIGTVTPAASAKGIRLQLIQDPAESYVTGDPARLQQVFWNLFSNAIKFTSKNGRVRVSVQSVGSNVEVVVDDNGLGIDAEYLPRVFDRFTQGDSSSTRHARGLGLGLSIARQLVELHGGSIQAASPGVGQGSTFTARFPRSPVTPTLLDPRGHSQADEIVRVEEWPDLTGIRALVVDDDDDTRGLLEKVLVSQGATVKTAPSAAEALKVLERERVDVLLTDIEMPGTDGYQLIKELRQRPAEQGGSVPAAALTACARTEDRMRALRAGFQLHLAKPVQPAELITVVGSLAARHN
jgi:signal transduction histidine kinase